MTCQVRTRAVTPSPNALTYFWLLLYFLFLFLIGTSVYCNNPGIQCVLRLGPDITFLCIAPFFFLRWWLWGWARREEVLFGFFLSSLIAILTECSALTCRQNQQDNENHSGRTREDTNCHAETLLTQNPLIVRVACNVHRQGDPQTTCHLKGWSQRKKVELKERDRRRKGRRKREIGVRTQIQLHPDFLAWLLLKCFDFLITKSKQW